MWIRVKSADGHRFSIPVPLFLAGRPWLWNMLAKYNGPDAAQMAPFARTMVRELRRYIRVHGHFCLVDVQDSEGDHVQITI